MENSFIHLQDPESVLSESKTMYKSIGYFTVGRYGTTCTVLIVGCVVDKLAGCLVEPALVEPTFLLHHPLLMSPLAKPHRHNPHLAERFELFAGK